MQDQQSSRLQPFHHVFYCEIGAGHVLENKGAADYIVGCWGQLNRAKIATDCHIEIALYRSAQLHCNRIKVDAGERKVNACKIKRPARSAAGLQNRQGAAKPLRMPSNRVDLTLVDLLISQIQLQLWLVKFH
jgi:hypothetical protein